MACSSRTRVATVSLLAGLLALSACGHFSVDLLPAAEDDLDGGGGGGDGSSDDDASISRDGATDAPADARGDGGLPLVCEGTMCPGVYVSSDVGNDANKGTAAEPVKTLQKAITIAQQRGMPTDVYVAGKSGGMKYPDPVGIVEGVSLYGGYDCSAQPCSWKRDVQNMTTYLVGQNYRGIIVPDVITRATVIDGFTIFGKGTTPDVATGAVAMTIEGAPTVRRCTILGNDLTGGVAGNLKSIGLAILGPATKDPNGPLLEVNDIRGGQATEESIGVQMFLRVPAQTSVSVSATLRANIIRGGAATKSFGIWARRTAQTTMIEDNLITAGNATGAENASWGISIAGPGTIFRNRINMTASSGNGSGPGCAGDGYCGGLISENGPLTIWSNIIRGARSNNAAAVLLLVVEGTGTPLVLNGNTLDPIGNGTDNGSRSAAIVLQNTGLADATYGKARNNILLGGENEFRYGVYEHKSNKQIHLQACDNNDFFNPGAATAGDNAYHVWNGNTETDVLFANLGTVTTPVPTLYKGVDPQFDETKPFHLKSTSPLIDKGTMTEAAAHDIDGDSRKQGSAPDIGADEAK